MIAYCEIQDLEQLFYIETKAQVTPWAFSVLEQSINCKDYVNLKFISCNKVCAFSICKIVLDEAELLNLAVEPEMQGQKIASKLLNNLILELQKQKCKNLLLEVRKSNYKAQNLYKKFGFKTISIRKNYYRHPTLNYEDALVMQLQL